MSSSLLATKLYAPQARSNAVRRARLAQRLLGGLEHAGTFALLSAPAGFGKTTVLSEFASQLPQPAAWLTLDEGDSDASRFWTYLIAACQTVDKSLGESAQLLLASSQQPSNEAVTTLLINDLSRLDRKCVLILDDYHLIQNPQIDAALAFLLNHLPHSLYVVLATRVDPPWPLSHWRVRDQLVEIRAADLRFLEEETTAFLNEVMELGLSAADVSALEARTEGWIASLQLAAISMKGRSDVGTFIRAFTGSHAYVAEYLLEEVLQRQNRPTREFLLSTSILNRMNASLCEAVTGQPGGHARLTEIGKANLFLVALDDRGEWYRYHGLFADLLRAHLRQSTPPDVIAALHRRAAAWYEQSGMAAEAIEHSLAVPDYEQAVDLVGRVALSMILQAHVQTVERWLQAIPAELRAASPRLDMAFAWLHLLRGNLEQAQPYLDRLGSSFVDSQAAEQDPPLYAEWLALQSKLCSLRGEPRESRDLAERALRILPESDLHVRSMLHLSLAAACEQLLDYEGAARIYRALVQAARTNGDSIAEILAEAAEARTLLQQGRLGRALEVAAEAVARLESSGRVNPFSATLYGELGQINYYRHQLDQAREYLQRSTQASGYSGYSDPEIYGHLIRSRIHQMEGDWASAGVEVERAAEVARENPPAMVREQLVSQQVRVDLALGRPELAQEALRAEGFSFVPAFEYPEIPQGSKMSLPLALLYNSALRVVLHEADGRRVADIQCAVDLAGVMLEQELARGEIPGALETLLLRSQLRRILGDRDGSLADAARALELAEPDGFISPIVEEGPPITDTLMKLLERRGLHGFLRSVLRCFPGGAGSEPSPARRLSRAEAARGQIAPLTRRELEVLQLIAAGHSNQVIADRLVITISAVKKHTGSIFRKLNVNSRTQALLRARELGLLSDAR